MLRPQWNSMIKFPVVVLNGFLGSGKTTLFRNLISQSIKKDITVFSIVNDMSELEVDAEILSDDDFLEHDSFSLKSISSCVLSSLAGIQELDEAINDSPLNKNLDLIIIETSGGCHPMPLIQYFRKQSLVQLTGFFVLVDSLVMEQDFGYGRNLIPRMQKNMMEGKRDMVNLLVEQIMFCSHLFLTKGDRIKKNKLNEIVGHIEKINPFSQSYSIIHGKLPIESLFEIEEYKYSNVEKLFKELQPILDSEQELIKPYGISTRILKDDRPFHPKRLWDTCHKYLDKRIYRSKGFFWLASRNNLSLIWNQAGGGINLEFIGLWRSSIVEDQNNRLSDFELEALKEQLKKEKGRFGDRRCDITIIGQRNQLDKFTEKLNSCFLNDKEIKQYNSGYVFEDPWPKNIAPIKI